MKGTGLSQKLLCVLMVVCAGCGGEDIPLPTGGAAQKEPEHDIDSGGALAEPELESQPVVATPSQRAAIQTVTAAGGTMDCEGGTLPTTIDLASDRVFADDAVVRAVLQFPNLRCLRVAVSHVKPETLAELKTLIHLREFLLQDAAVTDDELVDLLTGKTALERLTLRRLNQVTDRGVQAIAATCDVKVLALIEMNQLSGASLDHLQSIRNLRSLDLRNCGGLSAEDLSRVQKLERLTELKLGGPAVNDEVLAAAIQLPALTAITVEDAEVTSDGLRQLAANDQISSQLRSLSLARCFNVTDETLEMLGLFRSLETLALRDMMVGGAFVTSLADSTESPLPLKSLVLNDNSFLGDEAIAGLPKLAPALERLDLRRNAGVTDQSLDALRQLRNLKEIQLGETGISEAAAEQLSVDVYNGVIRSQ